MNMAENYALEGFKEIGRHIGQFCADNKAHILTGVSVVGTLGCGVLSARAGARSARKIDRREAELGRKLYPGEKLKLCGKDFIAPIASCAIAVVGSIGSDVVNTQTIARTNMALVASEKAYEALNRKTKEVLGEKKARTIKDEIAKEEIQTPGVITQVDIDCAPRTGVGTQFLYRDGYSKLIMWSNPDYIMRQLTEMREMMRDLAPRGDEYDYYDKEIGIPYSEWLSRMGFSRDVWDSVERKYCGWNKGYTRDGQDDDPIECIFSSVEWKPGITINEIVWEKDPTNMKLGRLLKANGL